MNEESEIKEDPEEEVRPPSIAVTEKVLFSELKKYGLRERSIEQIRKAFIKEVRGIFYLYENTLCEHLEYAVVCASKNKPEFGTPGNEKRKGVAA